MPTRVLHVGDRDPSGEHMFTALAEDVRAFAAAEGAVVEFERVAVTEAQVRTYHLPTVPATGWNRHCWTAAAFPEADVLVFGHIPWDSVTDTGLRVLNPVPRPTADVGPSAPT